MNFLLIIKNKLLVQIVKFLDKVKNSAKSTTMKKTAPLISRTTKLIHFQ